jgi:ATP-binding protein involved in chromosome partitioning
MFETVAVPLLGIIENMSYFVPPDMPKNATTFSAKAAAGSLAAEYNAPFLGEIRSEWKCAKRATPERPVVISNPESPQAIAFAESPKKSRVTFPSKR